MSHLYNMIFCIYMYTYFYQQALCFHMFLCYYPASFLFYFQDSGIFSIAGIVVKNVLSFCLSGKLFLLYVLRKFFPNIVFLHGSIFLSALEYIICHSIPFWPVRFLLRKHSWFYGSPPVCNKWLPSNNWKVDTCSTLLPQFQNTQKLRENNITNIHINTSHI